MQEGNGRACAAENLLQIEGSYDKLWNFSWGLLCGWLQNIFNKYCSGLKEGVYFHKTPHAHNNEWEVWCPHWMCTQLIDDKEILLNIKKP